MEKNSEAGKRPSFKNSRERDEWRRQLAEYASENGVSAASREFGTTRKTARLWMNRLQTKKESPQAETAPIKSETDKQEKPVTPEPTGRLKMVRRSSAISSNRRTELLELNRDITPVFRNRIRAKNGFAKETSDLPPRNYSLRGDIEKESRFIQFDCLNLGELPQFEKYVASGRIPQWQLTAVESVSGAAWVAFCHELSARTAVRFLKDLVSHLKKNGVDPERIYSTVNPESELGKLINLPGGEDFVFPAGQLFAGYHEAASPEHDLKYSAAEFHQKQIRGLYSDPVSSSIKKFIDSVHAFILRAGYEKKPGDNFLTPPYQTLCRLENGYCREDVLNFRPRILDFPKRKKSSQSAGITGIFGSVASVVKSVFARKKEDSGKVALPTGEKPDRPMTIPPSNPDKRTAKNAEFMNLRDINWKNTPARKPEAAIADRRQRNRREIIEQARAMLAERASDDELKNTLPITDGELALVKQRMGVTKYKG